MVAIIVPVVFRLTRISSPNCACCTPICVPTPKKVPTPSPQHAWAVNELTFVAEIFSRMALNTRKYVTIKDVEYYGIICRISQ